MALTLARLRRHLQDMDAPELRELLERLFAAGTDNRRLLSALLDNDTGELLARVQAEAEHAFGGGRRLPSLKVGKLRKALRDFTQVAAQPASLKAELDAVEAGIRCTARYGDLNEAAYTGIASIWASALKRCLGQHPDDIPWTRLERIRAGSEGYGWGFSDEMQALYLNFLTTAGAGRDEAG